MTMISFKRKVAGSIVIFVSMLVAGIISAADTENNILVKLERVDSLVSGGDNTTTITIYKDGRVETHYPIYRKRAGDYVSRLSVLELENLQVMLAESSLLAVEPAGFQAALVTGEVLEDKVSAEGVTFGPTRIKSLGRFRTDMTTTRLSIADESTMHTYALEGGTRRDQGLAKSPAMQSMQDISQVISQMGKAVTDELIAGEIASE